MKAWRLFGLMSLVLFLAFALVLACGDDDDDDDNDDDDATEDDDDVADDDDDASDDDDDDCDTPDNPETDCPGLCSTGNCTLLVEECGVFGDEQTVDGCIQDCMDACEAGCLDAAFKDCIENYTTCDDLADCVALYAS